MKSDVVEPATLVSHQSAWSWLLGGAVDCSVPVSRLTWLSILLLLVLSAADQGLANDWTRFQASIPAAAEGLKLPMTWSPTEHLAWKAALPGYGQSSPVTWSDRIYVTSISGPKKETCHVAAFNLTSGAKIWQFDLAAATQVENNNYVSRGAPTPVVDGNALYCFFEGGNLLSLTLDGKVRWQRNLVEEFGAVESRHGLAASLEQMDDRIFVWVERQANPYILAVDKSTGKDLWKSPGVGATSWASPRLIPLESTQHLVLSAVGTVIGIDPITGKELWKMTGITGNSTPTPVPAGPGRFLLGATQGRGETDSGKAAESNGLVAIRSQEDGSFKAEYVWRAKRATSSFGSPAVHQGQAYFVNATGVLFCLDLETGEERYSNRIGDSIWATPVPIGDRICFFGKGGTVVIVAAGPKFEKLAENTTWETNTIAPTEGQGAARTFGGPVLYAGLLVKDHLLLRRGDTLYCVTP
jgi:outer membrane protein assembly factor BamB